MASIKQNATKVAMSTAFVLAVMKAIIGFSTGSLAIISSAVDSILDIVSSSVNFLAIRKAEVPADRDHPFGHGKYESLATLIQSIIIFISGVFILISASHKFMAEEVVQVEPASLIVIIASIIITAFLVLFLRSIAKKEKSDIIKADAMHYSIDLFTNFGILVALVVIKVTGISYIDQLIAAVIALYIIYSAIKLSIKVMGELVDKRIEADIYKKLVDTLENFHDYTKDFHNLRTRSSGNEKFIDMHMTLCSKLTLSEVHSITDTIEQAIKEVIPEADIIIHPEPCEHVDCENSSDCNAERVKQGISQLLKR